MAPRKNFNPEEDLFVCMAFVKVSQDPIKGCDQKAESFWATVFDQFKTLCAKSKDPSAGQAKTILSLWNRFKRKIHKDVVAYQGIIKTMVSESGESDEDFDRRAKARFVQRHGHHFKFDRCVEVLAAMPKYSLENNETEADATKANVTVYSYVKHDRPQGNKAAKREVKEAAFKDNYQEKKIKVHHGMNSAMEKIANSALLLATSIQETTTKEYYMSLLSVHAKMGNDIGVQECLEHLKAIAPKPPTPLPPKSSSKDSVPFEINIETPSTDRNAKTPATYPTVHSNTNSDNTESDDDRSSVFLSSK